MTTPAPAAGATPVQALAELLARLADDYPTDDDTATTTPLTLADPATGRAHVVELQPGHLAWLARLVEAELATCRDAHAGGSGRCGHCGAPDPSAPPARAFAVGDRVRLLVGQHIAYTDEDLEAEGEDPTIRFDVPRGTAGQVVKVRDYPTPLPYVLLLADGREFGVAEHDIERAAVVEVPEG